MRNAVDREGQVSSVNIIGPDTVTVNVNARLENGGAEHVGSFTCAMAEQPPVGAKVRIRVDVA